MPTQKGRDFSALLKLKSWDLLKFPHNTRYKLSILCFRNIFVIKTPKKKKKKVIPKWKFDITWNREFQDNPVMISNFVWGLVVLPRVSKWECYCCFFQLNFVCMRCVCLYSKGKHCRYYYISNQKRCSRLRIW